MYKIIMHCFKVYKITYIKYRKILTCYMILLKISFNIL
jgi:hypothetical protein